MGLGKGRFRAAASFIACRAWFDETKSRRLRIIRELSKPAQVWGKIAGSWLTWLYPSFSKT